MLQEADGVRDVGFLEVAEVSALPEVVCEAGD